MSIARSSSCVLRRALGSRVLTEESSAKLVLFLLSPGAVERWWVGSWLKFVRNCDPGGTISAMGSTASVATRTGPDRRVPSWAAALVAGLSRDEPKVVTRADVAERLTEAVSDRSVDSAVHELRRLGWLVGLPIHGVWAFVPPGVGEILDPYIGLRAWHARDPDAGFMLCGATAAWHLGYLDRDPGSPAAVWLPSSTRLPDGLRSHVAAVKIDWADASIKALAPTSKFLIRRKLDLTRWASALPAFGPEALLAQLAVRPASFLPWADLLAHLSMLVDDADADRLASLLVEQPTAAWQRAAYLICLGGSPERASALFDRRPAGGVPKTRFAHPAIDTLHPVWVAEYNLIDSLVAPLQDEIGKA